MNESLVKSSLKELLLPLAVLLLLTLLFRNTDLDMQITRHFYHSGEGWIYAEQWFWMLLYKRGMIPGFLLGLVALLCLCLAWKLPKLRRQWRSYLLLVLLLLIGPGLLVNSLFKDNWGRTRPKHVIEFGGHLPFIKIWDRGERGVNKSFPSGHASIGFYTIAPFFVLRRRRKRLAGLFLCGGTVYGLLMGCGRIAQGGHFPSDVVWAWGMVYLSGLLLCYLLKPEKPTETHLRPPALT
ncbi:MAG: phosphatase PAP2 family protein [Desulfuromonadaceae bacterium]|nr:phosphatase PAP2 family protein [Desulfuromonadaceae bacterium]